MLIATEKREHYRGLTLIAVPNQTNWGWRIENEHGGRVASRGNGGSTSADVLALARERANELLAAQPAD